MNISLEYYKVFYQVARLGSISLAAEELFISQPAVSQAVKQLEMSLGGTLFMRTPKGMRLTPEGELLYSYISEGYETILLGENKFSELLNLEAGEVRIGASDMTLEYYLLPFLEEFHRRYPKIKVKVTNAPTPETTDFLRRGNIDFGVVSEPILEARGLKVKPVSEIQDIFISAERFSYLKGRTIPLKELDSLPIICLEGVTSTKRYVDAFLKENNVALNPEFELATSGLIVQFTLRNLGVGSVVSKFAEKDLQSGRLFALKLEKPIPPRKLCIITSDKNPVSPAGKRLLELINS